MAIALGGNQISKAYLGNTEIQKMYLGSTLVFDQGVAPPVVSLKPVLYNFRVIQSNLNRLYFDATSDITGLTLQGFKLTSSKAVSIITIDTDKLGGYLTVSPSYDFWDNDTIRLESGNGIVDDFSMEAIDNQATEPTATTIKYVDTVGGGNGDSVGSPWSVSQANTAAAGTTIYVKVGQYNGVTWNPNNNGTASNPIKFIGYKTTPGDLDNVWIKDVFDYVDTANANTYIDPTEWPVFTGTNVVSSSGIRLTEDYIIIKNIQVEHYHYNIWSSSGNYISIQNTTAANGYDTIAANVGSGFYYGNTRVFNIRTYKCVSFDNSGQNYYYRGENHLFENNSSWGGDNEGNRPVDYYLNGYDCSFNIIKDNYVERSAALSHGGHGIGFKNSNTGCEYNLIVGNDVRGLRGEIYYAAHQDTAYNVFKRNYTYGADGDSAVLVARNGAHHNLYENNKGEHCKYSVYLWANPEDQPIVSGNAAADNIFRNNMFIEVSSCVTTSNSNSTTYAIKDNQIYGNTFYEEKATVQGVFWSTETTGHALTYSGNTFKNNLLVNLDMPLYADFAQAGEFAITYGNFFNNQFATPSGTGNASFDPQFNNVTDLVPTNDALIACPQLDNYDYSGDQRFDPTTYGGEINPNEQGVAPPVTDYDFYVSATGTGDGLTEESPMSFADSQTTINSMTSGQSIAYKGGDSFDGNLIVTNRTGITIGSYDTGKARISGLEDISGFINQGSNVWRATAPSTIYQVFKNDDRIAIGRYPANYSDSGALSNYYQVDTKVSTTSFTASELVGIPSLVGGSVTVLNAAWYSQTRTILTHNTGSGTITYDVMYEGQGAVGTGDLYCVQNHSSLNISQDNWSYNNGYLYIYSTTEPTNITIATNSGIGVAMSGCDNVALQNIEVKGFYSRGLELTNSDNLDISGCEIRDNYVYGIYDTGGVGSVIDNNIIDGTNHVGLEILSTSTMTNNTITDTAVIENLTATGIGSAIGAGTAVELAGGNIFRYNTIDRTGYNGIFPVDNASTIEFNKVSNSNLTLHDGAGIYAHYPGDGTRDATGTVINNNIVIGNGFGGQTWYAIGIYTDDRTHGITIENNTIIGTYYGYYMHNTKDHVVRYNNMYASINQVSYLQEDTIPNEGDGYMTGNTFTYNNLFSTNTSINQDLAMWIRSSWDTNLDFGTIDFNRYWNPYYSYCVGYSTNVRNNGAGYEPLKFDMPGWLSTGLGALEGFDANSEQDSLNWTYPEADTKSQIVYNDTKTQATYPLSGTWYGMDGAEYIGSITLQPFTSEILINETPTPPNPNPELLTNGDFSNGSTGWNLFSGATLNVDEITINTTGTYSNMLSQTGIVGLDNGSTYIVTGTISNYVNGQVRVWLGTNLYSCPRANGDFTAELIMDTADGIYYIKTGGDTTTGLTLDNLSLKLK